MEIEFLTHNVSLTTYRLYDLVVYALKRGVPINDADKNGNDHWFFVNDHELTNFIGWTAFHCAARYHTVIMAC